MAEQERARCPVCGDADSTVNLRAWHAEKRVRIAEGREAAERQLAQPRTRPAADGGSDGSSGGGDAGSAADLGIDLGEEVLLGLISLGLIAAWRKLVWNPLKYRALPALWRRSDEVMRNYSAMLDRHPDLWMCGPDEVVFRAGGGKTVPARDAFRWLARGDDVKLMAALGQN